MKSFPLRTFIAVLLITATTLLSSCGGGSSSAPTASVAPLRITFPGIGAIGIFDPAVTADPASGRLWMSYSEVGVSLNSDWGVSIRLAFSDDAGSHWTDAGLVAPFTDVTVGPLTTLPGAPTIPAASPGTWQNETSTLVYDSNAPAGERWKLLWFQVLWANNLPYFADYSWIAMKAAATPAGLAAATPVKLFSGYVASADGEITTTPTFSPIGGPAQIALETQDPELAHCVFAEPGIIKTMAGLYLTLDCHSIDATIVPYITLFDCAYPACAINDATKWHYVGRILTPADAQDINAAYKGYSGTALTEQDGIFYLLATPVAVTGDRYDGCRVYRFTDLAAGTLQRASGALVTVAQVDGTAGTHHGACAHHAALGHGILLSQMNIPATPEIFQVMQSGINIP